MKTLDKSDQLANRYQETEVSVVWKLWKALLLRTAQQVNSNFPVWIHHLFKAWDYPNGVNDVATLFLLLQQVSGETPSWLWVSIWFFPIMQLLFWKRFLSVSKKRNKALSETVYCLNVWSFHEQYRQSFCFTFENIRIRLRLHLWVLVSTYSLYFQSIKKHLPFHQRSLQDMIQDNCFSPQILWFSAALDQKCKEIRKRWVS